VLTDKKEGVKSTNVKARSLKLEVVSWPPEEKEKEGIVNQESLQISENSRKLRATEATKKPHTKQTNHNTKTKQTLHQRGPNLGS